MEYNVGFEMIKDFWTEEEIDLQCEDKPYDDDEEDE